MAFLINGFFYQKKRFLDVAVQSEVEGGAAAFINSQLFRTMFAGIIYPDPDNQNFLIGQIMDHYGESFLNNVKLSEIELEFEKCYSHRCDTIKYEFTLNNGIYMGRYSGEAVGGGEARCIITPAPENFFNF